VETAKAEAGEFKYVLVEVNNELSLKPGVVTDDELQLLGKLNVWAKQARIYAQFWKKLQRMR
jgi:hypothetical protein